MFSTPDRTRTCDPRFRKPVLYPLSYEGEPKKPVISGLFFDFLPPHSPKKTV